MDDYGYEPYENDLEEHELNNVFQDVVADRREMAIADGACPECGEYDSCDCFPTYAEEDETLSDEEGERFTYNYHNLADRKARNPRYPINEDGSYY